MAEKPLYDKNGAKIDVLPGSDSDYFLCLGKSEYTLMFPRGVLEELASQPDHMNALRIIQVFCPEIYPVLSNEEVTPADLFEGVREAYAEDEKRYHQFVLEESCEGCGGRG